MDLRATVQSSLVRDLEFVFSSKISDEFFLKCLSNNVRLTHNEKRLEGSADVAKFFEDRQEMRIINSSEIIDSLTEEILSTGLLSYNGDNYIFTFIFGKTGDILEVRNIILKRPV